MKKLLTIAGLAIALGAQSQTEPVTNVTVINGPDSPVPVYLTSTPDSAESTATTFWQGVGVGFAWGGIAWIFRLVRQTAKHNPEI